MATPWISWPKARRASPAPEFCPGSDGAMQRPRSGGGLVGFYRRGNCRDRFPGAERKAMSLFLEDLEDRGLKEAGKKGSLDAGRE